MKPDISLCMIVRNEEAHLNACLESVQHLVDETIVVDTGSTDRTPALAAERGARVHPFPWCDDFSAARNESLRLAAGRWIFWLDADDRVDRDNEERLRALFGQLRSAAGATNAGYLMTCRSSLPTIRGQACQVSHLRVFPREAALRWTGRVHERLEQSDGHGPLSLRWSDVQIQHVGYADPVQRRRKLERNLRLLQLDFASHPDDAVTLFHLGWCHLELSHYAESLRFLKRSLRGDCRVSRPQAGKAQALIVECLSQMQRKQEALEVCTAALRQYPNDTELLFRQGHLLGVLGDFAGSESCFLQLLTTPSATAFEYGVEVGLRGAKAHYMLGLLYEQQGRIWEAELQYRGALAAQPDYCFAWVGLGQLHLASGRLDEFQQAVTHLAACPDGDIMAPTLLARLRIIEGRFDEARALLDAAMARDPELLWPRMVLSDLLFASGSDWRLCVQLHRQILQTIPNQPGIRQRLEQLLAQRHECVAPLATDEGAHAAHAGSSVAIAVGS